MSTKQTTLRHVWLAGLGVMARARSAIDRITGRVRIEEAPPAAFVTTHKPAKRSPPAPAGARRAWESTPRRRSDGQG